jgi:hypothetical protein
VKQLKDVSEVRSGENITFLLDELPWVRRIL